MRALITCSSVSDSIVEETALHEIHSVYIEGSDKFKDAGQNAHDCGEDAEDNCPPPLWM